MKRQWLRAKWEGTCGAGGAHITSSHWGVTLAPCLSAGGGLVGTYLLGPIAGKSTVQTKGGLTPEDICHLAGSVAPEC